MDENGKDRARLSVDKGKAEFILYNKKGNCVVDIRPDENDGFQFRLFNGKGHSTVGLSAGKKGSGLVMSDDDGNMRVLLTADKKYGSMMGFYDSSGSIRTGIVADKRESALDFFDDEGGRRVRLGLEKSSSKKDARFDHANLMLLGDNYKARIAMYVVEDLLRLVIQDAEGKQLWAAPTE